MLDLEHGRALGRDRFFVMIAGLFRLSQRRPEVGRGEAARLEVGVFVPVLEKVENNQQIINYARTQAGRLKKQIQTPKKQ